MFFQNKYKTHYLASVANFKIIKDTLLKCEGFLDNDKIDVSLLIDDNDAAGKNLGEFYKYYK